MNISEISAGRMKAAVTRNTAWLDRKYPVAPIASADSPVPSDAKRALRPSRSPISAWPTSPRLIAAIAGPSTQTAAACSVMAPSTTGKIGHIDKMNALAPMVTMASAATSRSERAASTSAPPGIWPASATSPAIVSTRPMSNCVQCCAVR
jgi:hypothetical protein